MINLPRGRGSGVFESIWVLPMVLISGSTHRTPAIWQWDQAHSWPPKHALPCLKNPSHPPQASYWWFAASYLASWSISKWWWCHHYQLLLIITITSHYYYQIITITSLLKTGRLGTSNRKTMWSGMANLEKHFLLISALLINVGIKEAYGGQ